jgi:hypothetical protein
VTPEFEIADSDKFPVAIAAKIGRMETPTGPAEVEKRSVLSLA